MSEIKSQLTSMIKEAMKAGEKEKVTTLRGLSAAIKQVEVDTRKELTDADVTSVFQKEMKKLKDTLSFAEQQNREEMVEKTNREINLLQDFLGKELSDAELGDEIKKLIGDGADNIGKVMGGLNQKFKGRFDGKMASTIAKELLG